MKRNINLSSVLSKIKPKGYIIIALVLVLCIVLGCFFSVIKDFFGFEKSRETIVTIPDGATITKISEILEKDGLIEYPKAFRLAAKTKNYVIQQGRHYIDTSMSYFGILDKLTKVPDAGYDNIYKVLIPEGYEIKEIARKLDELDLCDSEEFIECCENGEFDYPFVKEIKRKENRLEGYLFPAIYEIQKGESASVIIGKMLDKFESVVIPLYEKAECKYTLDEIVTMASIIEREAANDSERKLVSSVFYNRLKYNMAFGSCATVQYVLNERKDILSVSDTKIESPYNTYKYKGLPPGPIASPGEKSIEAALFPDETDYLYFAAKADGSGNVFTKSSDEHINTVKKLQK